MKSVEEIRQLVLKYLESKGMSQRQFCKKFHYSPGHFSEWLKGERNFSTARLMSLEIMLGDKYYVDERISRDKVLQLFIELWQGLTPSQRYEVLAFVEKQNEQNIKSTLDKSNKPE